MIPNAHLQRRQLEGLVANADPASEAEARQHVGSCLICRKRLAAIENARSAYLAAFPAEDFVRQVAARAARVSRERAPSSRATSRRWWLAGFSGLAVALGALAFFVNAPSNEIRLKGGPSWQVVAKRGERTWTIDEGAALLPGDRLAFTYALGEDRYFMLFGIDDAGTVSQYGAAGDGAPLRLARGAGRVPFAIELDDRPGEERLFALFSASPIDAEATKRALGAAFARARAEHRAVAATEISLPAQILTLGFVKK